MNRIPLRRTKILATLGPATDDPAMLDKLMQAGLDAVRANFSHGSADDHARRIQAVRKSAAKFNKEIAVVADLQGPKIRIAQFQKNKIMLAAGATFTLDVDLAKDAGDQQQVGIDYPQLPQDVKPNDILLLDDGRIVLQVVEIKGQRIVCCVVVGGELSNNKGINRQGGGLSAAALTEKDKADLQTAVALGVDYIAISFPRSAQDVHEARALVRAINGNAGIIAKIERAEAITEIDAIINASDGVMVARGDLGVEIGDAELPEVQKHIIQRARTLDRFVITATQMMESMIHNAIPTRAEVFDVANAVLDGTDVIMLSAETATGEHPDVVIAAVNRICLGAEKQLSARTSRHRVECQFKKTDEAIAMAAMYTANHFDVKAIIALTESGGTPLWMSRIRSGIPIFGFTSNIQTQRKMALYRGVYPIYFDVTKSNTLKVDEEAVQELQHRNIVSSGEFVVVTHGDLMGVHGGTNNMKIVRVE